MRRIVSALFVCAALGATAAPAVADNSHNQPPGPPDQSGGPNTTVIHCKDANGTKSVVVINSQGISGGGDCLKV